MAVRKPAARKRIKRPSTAAAEPRILEHELQVHQEELRAQNEKLVAALLTLEETRDRFIELYDFAPIGYLTLDMQGVIREINLGAAALLGRPRQDLVGFPLADFFERGRRGRFLIFLRACRQYGHGAWPNDELPLRSRSGSPVSIVHLVCSPRAESASRARELFIVMTDVSARKELEAERERAHRLHTHLARQLMSVQERERRLMAQDIHDDLGQRVTGLRLKLEWLASLVAAPGPVSDAIAQVQEQAVQLDRHVDFLLRQLRPAGLDDFGLDAALRQTVRDWSQTFGIAADFHSSGFGTLRLPHETEAHLYRIVQEGLNNVYKHAGAAAAVRVALVRHDGRVTLTIHDSGAGFTSGGLQTQGMRRGLGLVGMQERAALIGATLDVRSRPGKGTTISIDFADVPEPA